MLVVSGGDWKKEEEVMGLAVMDSTSSVFFSDFFFISVLLLSLFLS